VNRESQSFPSILVILYILKLIILISSVYVVLIHDPYDQWHFLAVKRTQILIRAHYMSYPWSFILRIFASSILYILTTILYLQILILFSLSPLYNHIYYSFYLIWYPHLLSSISYFLSMTYILLYIFYSLSSIFYSLYSRSLTFYFASAN